MAPVSEAGESSKAYKRSHNETINQIPNHHTWSFTGRVGPQARLGSPSSALPARPPSSPSPTEAISSTSHASYGKFNQHDEVLSKDFQRASESNRRVMKDKFLQVLKRCTCPKKIVFNFVCISVINIAKCITDPGFDCFNQINNSKNQSTSTQTSRLILSCKFTHT